MRLGKLKQIEYNVIGLGEVPPTQNLNFNGTNYLVAFPPNPCYGIVLFFAGWLNEN